MTMKSLSRLFAVALAAGTMLAATAAPPPPIAMTRATVLATLA